MKIKIPKEIKIASHTYEVKHKRFLGKDTGFRGTIEHRIQEIWIDPVNPLSQRNATLLHEVLHLISQIYSIGLEDDAVDRIAEGFAELLFDNLDMEFDWSLIEGGE